MQSLFINLGGVLRMCKILREVKVRVTVEVLPRPGIQNVPGDDMS